MSTSNMSTSNMSTSNIAHRPLTVEEWEKRLATAEGLLLALETEVAIMILAIDNAGDATGLSSAQRLDVIHSAYGKLGSLKNQADLARRRIEKGLV